MNDTNKKIAVVGTGVIGASWAACFLSKGYDVAATDPAAGAEERLRKLVQTWWPTLERMGMTDDASPERLSFHASPEAAVQDAVFIQESGPERLDIKRATLAQISAAAPADTLIATSSSGIPASQIQDAAQHPERVLIGHPFNPPHLIPLVEVVGGRLTSAQAIEKAMRFYESLGKKAIHIRREVKGHVANRLQAALWREAFHLVQEGVASVSDIDAAIAHGPGLRWALLGPFLNVHLSGGEGGIEHFLEHLGPPVEDWWADLGEVKLNPELNQLLIAGVDQELGTANLADIVAQRDELLLTLLKLKAQSDLLP
ncbi:3-hydroxyacyl-CoA dehydrogenase [Pusillimonas sp. MFBS29]|uniref:3-hydroxyacyl-CoA dehydrogenase NAD-binding domain-containing protein n=1 Tax=Pusillimonas sp. MFBS29 TaxID=2886690 RepID=UPI001D1069DF|nr:3-hydroxyacyl-CoA dehydrogenase NAD-binding domain-containing protein [Pusillimonas sp. MFBS29]MCC2595222.1 3-hydroxyacyl-CoA dehydrogenase [Pusillimonas sp. MFBS29]